MQRDPEFRFTDTRLSIAFTCDLFVEMEADSEDTFLTFCQHVPIPLDYTVGVLATKDSFFNEAGLSSYKQILARLNLLLLATQMFVDFNNSRGEPDGPTPYPYENVSQMLLYTL